MKKVLLTAAIAVLSFATTQAQEIKFGVKAGLNVSTIGGDFGVSEFDSDLREDTKSAIGFHIGGLAEIMLSDKFALQPELMFSQQGAKVEFTDVVDPEFSFEQTTTLSYVNLPIMAKFYPVEGFSIEVGPQFGFLVSDNDDFTNDSTPDPEDAPEYKSFDYGVNVGVGYKMETGLMFQLRYNIGLADIDDVPDGLDGLGVLGNTFSRKNRVLQVSVGYMF